MYVPDGPGPFPAVLGTAGHADEGKASPTYQHAWVSLARRGFLVLAYDPPGQGERLEYLDPAKGGSRVGIGTREHSMTGQQVLLTGRTIGAYMVQDMRRALDYLRDAAGRRPPSRSPSPATRGAARRRRCSVPSTRDSPPSSSRAT